MKTIEVIAGEKIQKGQLVTIHPTDSCVYRLRTDGERSPSPHNRYWAYCMRIKNALRAVVSP